MDYPKYFYPINSLNLFCLEENFNFLSSLYTKNKLPKVIMLSGSKGSGKSTLINHFLISIFDEKNYDKKELKILETSDIYYQYKNEIFQNIISLHGSNYDTVKIENIRNLKKNILQSSLLNNDRFIILDDAELFNINSLNALLKIIEEPNKNNYFILINNKSKPLLDTIRSRCIEIKIIPNENQRLLTINKLAKLHNIDITLNPEKSKLSPGNFLKFNYICNELNISVNKDFLSNFSLLLNLYKKNKDIMFINLIYFLADFYFKISKDEDIIKKDKIYEMKTFVFDNLSKYLRYNLSQNSLINAITNKLSNE
tara:strand:- start:826 stop:1761 length:936 start_codon:yes stop_codon:yes gene_type:complete